MSWTNRLKYLIRSITIVMGAFLAFGVVREIWDLLLLLIVFLAVGIAINWAWEKIE